MGCAPGEPHTVVEGDAPGDGHGRLVGRQLHPGVLGGDRFIPGGGAGEDATAAVSACNLRCCVYECRAQCVCAAAREGGLAAGRQVWRYAGLRVVSEAVHQDGRSVRRVGRRRTLPGRDVLAGKAGGRAAGQDREGEEGNR